MSPRRAAALFERRYRVPERPRPGQTPAGLQVVQRDGLAGLLEPDECALVRAGDGIGQVGRVSDSVRWPGLIIGAKSRSSVRGCRWGLRRCTTPAGSDTALGPVRHVWRPWDTLP